MIWLRNGDAARSVDLPRVIPADLLADIGGEPGAGAGQRDHLRDMHLAGPGLVVEIGAAFREANLDRAVADLEGFDRRSSGVLRTSPRTSGVIPDEIHVDLERT